MVALVTPILFSQSQLAQIVDETLPQLPPSHTSAIIAGVDQRGVQVVARFQFQHDHWAVTAAARHEWTGENGVAAKVLLSW